MLLMIPDEFIDADVVLDALTADETSLIGPSKTFSSGLCEEDDDLRVLPLGRNCEVLVVDVSDEVLPMLSDYDPVTHDFENCACFDADRPAAIPIATDVIANIKSWIEGVTEARMHFYSAREDPEPPAKSTPKKGPAKKITNHAIMEQLIAVQAQMKAIQVEQDKIRVGQASPATPVPAPFTPMPATSKMPGLSAGLQGTGLPLGQMSRMLGPPPKAKPPAVPDAEEVVEIGGDGGGDNQQGSSSDPMLKALSQQSQALTALVAHLAGGDPLTELQSGASSTGGSLSSKGVARRERMQQDLANRQSSYFMQIQQQLFRRMYPSLPVPKTESELTGYGATMTSYMERQGGYRHCKDQALSLWIAAHAMDSAMVGDTHGCKEFLALLIVCMDQASYDGNWNVAYLLSLLETPPATVFSDRVISAPGLERPFSPLVPQQWAACALSYMKEVDLLATKKTELRAPKAAIPKPPPSKAQEPDQADSPSPRRRPKFPKKPKGSPDPKSA